MSRLVLFLILVIGVLASILITSPAFAHQPYFEEQDIGPDAPWLIADPTISTALYATLESKDDVDYFAFDGSAGQDILLAITIPQIEGQEEFAPTLALLGPGLQDVDLPRRVTRSSGAGVFLVPPPTGPAPTFFEPFSRTSYWERQEQRVTLPADGRYVVAVWHDNWQPGRYVFVIGDKERLGGDPAFPRKMAEYWTPVKPVVNYKCQSGLQH
jgi:hypothetical protein